MGSINQSQFKTHILKFKDDVCPLCDNKMTPMPISYEDGWDGFHYKCKNCNPNVVIGFSGSLLCDRKFVKVMEDAFTKYFLIQKIKNCKTIQINIATNDVP